MNLNHLIFVIFVYSIPANFDFSGFLASCKTKGIKLYAETEADSPHGYAAAGGGKLTVKLYEKEVASLPANAKSNFHGKPGNAVLTGARAGYKSTIDAAVSSNQ